MWSFYKEQKKDVFSPKPYRKTLLSQNKYPMFGLLKKLSLKTNKVFEMRYFHNSKIWEKHNNLKWSNKAKQGQDYITPL